MTGDRSVLVRLLEILDEIQKLSFRPSIYITYILHILALQYSLEGRSPFSAHFVAALLRRAKDVALNPTSLGSLPPSREVQKRMKSLFMLQDSFQVRDSKIRRVLEASKKAD